MVYPQQQYRNFDEFMHTLWQPAEDHFDRIIQDYVGENEQLMMQEQANKVQLVPFHPLAHFEGGSASYTPFV